MDASKNQRQYRQSKYRKMYRTGNNLLESLWLNHYQANYYSSLNLTLSISPAETVNN